MACLAPRESHAARACRQGRKRSRAWKEKSPDGSFSRCSRAERMGEELEKVSRPLLAARRRATLRVQGAPGRVSDRRGGGVRYGIGHGRRGFRAWDAICRRLLGRSRGFTSGRRVEDGGAFPSRGAATLIGTASPVPLTADMRTGAPAARRLSMRNGYGAAQHVRRKKEDG